MEGDGGNQAPPSRVRAREGCGCREGVEEVSAASNEKDKTM